MIFLWTSNDLHRLAAILAERMGQRSPASPLRPEFVLVQTHGMGRWLSLQLALRHGISANMRYLFPNALLRDVVEPLCAVPAADDPWAPDNLVWSVADILSDPLIGDDVFRPVRDYLAGSAGGGETGVDVRHFQLARQAADVLDQYTVYRPGLTEEWEGGRRRYPGQADEAWQAALWRELVQRHGRNHRAARWRELGRQLATLPTESIQAQLERLWVFGIATLSPFHLNVLETLARRIDVSVFLLSPCREFWGDIRRRRDVLRQVGRATRPEMDAAALHLEEGNSLLAGLGTLGRHFFDALLELDGVEQAECYADVIPTGVLGRIQADMLDLINRGHRAGDEGAERLPLTPDDDSIGIVSCHSPLREVEVLHQHLLRWFDRDPTLTPGDVVVMAPRIDEYASLVQAVFDSAPDRLCIPYAIADRSLRAESPLAGALLRLLELADSRFAAPDVISLLESEPVRRKFGLTDGDLERVRHWIRETGIRWALDGPDKGRFNLPPYPENTWQSGLQRLMLGYALGGGEDRDFAGVWPYDEVEGESAEVLGRLAECIMQLASVAGAFRQPRSLAAWADELAAAVLEFVADDPEWAPEMAELLRIFRELGRRQEITGLDKPLDLATVRYYLQEILGDQGLGFGFLTGRLTFCSMIPMRSIPFRVICLLGMNDEDFPRQGKATGFDLTRISPQPLDRSPRESDRFLFLEILISARDRLYISYVGRSSRDNSERQPSVLVTELLDVIARGFFRATPDGKPTAGVDADPTAQLVTIHPLHAFSRRYFSGTDSSRLFSFDSAHAAAVARLVSGERRGVWLDESVLPEPGEEFRELELAQLIRFFRNPAEFFCRNRLWAVLPRPEEMIQPVEPFKLDPLSRYLLEEELLAADDLSAAEEELFRRLVARGVLPHGNLARREFDGVLSEVRRLAERRRAECGTAALSAQDFELELTVGGLPFRLRGHLDSLYERGRIVVRPVAKMTARDRLSLWLSHLALNSLPDRIPRESVFLDRESHHRLLPVEDPVPLLGAALTVYWLGLRGWLALAPETSLTYAVARGHDKGEDQALAAAYSRWAEHHVRPEQEDPYLGLAFRRRGVFDGNEEALIEFREMALTVFEPVLRHFG
ncbi:MAG: exodeoxyribonuclease V subunit gamma [Acidobacteria bacterium]|nr:exodeoxyribonuclease V subunit gamma [Acidobacteriota bacterium]